MFDRHRRARVRRLIASVAVTAGVVVGSVAGVPSATAQTNPFERGPNPTLSALQADRGPFAVSETTVSRSAARGFGGGTIYYPTSTTAGTFGAIAVSPGFTATQSSISWYGPRLASHGFVVFTIDTESRYDQPSSRGTQLLAALDYLTQRSTVRSRIDSSRLGVMGHSMGGGGALTASATRPSLQAAIPLTGYHTRKDWSGNRVPTLVIGAQDDRTAPVSSHSEPFYESLPSTPDKAYLELAGASHFAPNSPNDTIAVSSIAWLKRFVDNDVRYERFLCPAPSGSAIEEYRDTCPSAS